MVPISSDATRVIRPTRPPVTVERRDALIHPAVPPPTMTIFCCADGCIYRSFLLRNNRKKVSPSAIGRRHLAGQLNLAVKDLFHLEAATHHELPSVLVEVRRSDRNGRE